MLEASAMRTSLQHAVDDATASVVEQQRERDALKQVWVCLTEELP